MTNSKYNKILISLVIIIAIITSITIPAFADSPGKIRAKSWIASAITALNITLQPINYAGQYAVQQAVDPLGVVTTIQEQEYASYMDRSTIKIYPDVVEIDGQLYTDIWLSHDAADKFRTEGLDFATAYSLASNTATSTQYTSGEGYLDDTPMFSVSGDTISQNYIVSSTSGDYPISDNVGVRISDYTATKKYKQALYQGNTFGTKTNNSISNYPLSFYFFKDGNTYRLRYKTSGGTGGTLASFSSNELNYNASPFEFDYVSGSIPVDPLPTEEGLYIRVPSSHSNPSHPDREYNIPEYVQDNPDLTEYTFNFDPSLNPDADVDIDLSNGLGDLISAIILGYLMDLINDPNVIIDFEEDPEPSPPIVPETIGQTLWSVLENWLSRIHSAIENVVDTLQDILVNILDSILDAFDSILESIQDFIQAFQDAIQDILDAIQNIQDVLQDILQDIADILSELLEDIESAPIRIFDKVLDLLQSILLPIIAWIKLHFGIWHYVVEWIGAISTSFLYFFGIMSNSSYNLVLPIYAGIAGYICIKIYKAFGR